MASFIRMMRGADIDEDDTEAEVFEKLLQLPEAKRALNESLRKGIPDKAQASTPTASQKAMERLVGCMIAVNQSRESSRSLIGKLRSVQRELKSTKDQCLEFEQELIKTKTQLAMNAEDKETLQQSNRRLKRLSMGMGAPVAPITPVATPVALRVDPALVRSNERLRATLQALTSKGTQLNKSTELLRKESAQMSSALRSRLAHEQEEAGTKLAERQRTIDDYEVKQKYELAELDKSLVICKNLKERHVRALEQNTKMVLTLKKLSDALVGTSKEVNRASKVNGIIISKISALRSKQDELVQHHRKLGEDLGRSVVCWKQRFESEAEGRRRAESEVQLWKSKPVKTVDPDPIRDRLGALYTRLSDSRKQIKENHQLITFLSTKYSDKYSEQRRRSQATISTLTASHHEKMEAMKQFIRNMEIERDQTKLELEEEKAQVRRLSAGENSIRKSFGEKDAQLLQHKVALRDVINHYKHTNSELEVAREELAGIKKRDMENETKRMTALKVKNRRLAAKFDDIMAWLEKVRTSQTTIRGRSLEWSKNQLKEQNKQQGQLEESRKLATRLSGSLERVQAAAITMATTYRVSQARQSERISCLTSMSRGKIQALSQQLKQGAEKNQEMRENLRVSVEKTRSAQVAQAESLRRREFRQSLAVNEAGQLVARLKKATFLMSQRVGTDVKAFKRYQGSLIECRDHYREQAMVQRDRVSRMAQRLNQSDRQIKEMKGLLVRFSASYEAKRIGLMQSNASLVQVTLDRERLAGILSLQVVPILQAIMKSCRVTETIERAADLFKSTKEELSLATQDLTIQQSRCRHQSIRIQELEAIAKEDRRRYEEILEEAADSKDDDGVTKVQLCHTLDRLNEINGRIREMQANLCDSIVPAISKTTSQTTSAQLLELSKLQDSVAHMKDTRNRMIEAIGKEQAASIMKDKKIEKLASQLNEKTRQHGSEKDQLTLKLRASNQKIVSVKSQMAKLIPSIELGHQDKVKTTYLVTQMSLLLQKLLRHQKGSRRITEKICADLEHQRSHVGQMRRKIKERSEDVRRSGTEADELKVELFGAVAQMKDRLSEVQQSNSRLRAVYDDRLEAEHRKSHRASALLDDFKSKAAPESERLHAMMGELSAVRAGLTGLAGRVRVEEHQKLREIIALMAGKMQDQMEIGKIDKARLGSMTAVTKSSINQSRSFSEGAMRLVSQLGLAKGAMVARNVRIQTGMSVAMEESHRYQEDMKDHLDILGTGFESQKTEIVALKERLAFAESMPHDDHKEGLEHVRGELKEALDKIRQGTLQQKQLKSVMASLSGRVSKSRAEKAAMRANLSKLSAALLKAQQTGTECHQMTDSMALHCKLEREDLLAELVGLQDDNKRIREQMAQQNSSASLPVRTAPADRLMIGEAKHVLGCLVSAYKEKCEQLRKLKGEQDKMRVMVPQILAMTKHQLTVSCTRQVAIMKRTQKQQVNEPLYLDPQSDMVRMIIEDLADELAETQEELKQVLQLCRVKLVEDMSSRKVNRSMAEEEFVGLCRLNEIERTRSTAPHQV